MFAVRSNLSARLYAAGVHLLISGAIAVCAGWLVFSLWYPYPYSEISGGRDLFFLVVVVDVVLGPLLTLAVFNRSKPAKELMRDLAIIALLQIGALGYGLWTVAIVRPVHLVFEIDRFRVVHAIDISKEELSQAPEQLRHLPWLGPTSLSIREFKDDKEKFDTTMLALQGLQLSMRPGLWQSYDRARLQVRSEMKPFTELKSRFPEQTATLDEALKTIPPAKRAENSLGYVPVIGNGKFWTALVDSDTAEVVAFVPIDSF